MCLPFLLLFAFYYSLSSHAFYIFVIIFYFLLSFLFSVYLGFDVI